MLYHINPGCVFTQIFLCTCSHLPSDHTDPYWPKLATATASHSTASAERRWGWEIFHLFWHKNQYYMHDDEWIVHYTEIIANCIFLESSSRKKKRTFAEIYSHLALPRCRWSCLLIGTDLEKFIIPSLSHQWILCSEWGPSEWESKQLYHITPDVTWWTGVASIIVIFLSANCILMAPIHCRQSCSD